VLSRALLAGASGQLRNKASTGGNLLQRTRCYYFYDTRHAAAITRSPGSGCDAIGGFNRILAILGTSDHCIATHPSDMAVAMRALDATDRDAQAGRRPSPYRDRRFLPAARATPQIETVLERGELITHIALPPPPRQAALSQGARPGILCLRAGFGRRDRRVEDGRRSPRALAFGGLGPMPWRDPAVEAALVGQAPGIAIFAAAADALVADAKGRGANDFKIPLARRTLIAVLRDLTGA
jgi:xanthine dehydrogenase YagS FAD-binding subunit